MFNSSPQINQIISGKIKINMSTCRKASTNNMLNKKTEFLLLIKNTHQYF